MKNATAIMTWFRLSERHAPQIMLARRLKPCKTFVDYYAAPGGSVEKDECIILAAQREMREETGMYRSTADFRLTGSYLEKTFTCYTFELNLSSYDFSQIRNVEPNKHTDWELFNIDEALALPKLMPAIEQILLTKRQIFSKLKTLK